MTEFRCHHCNSIDPNLYMAESPCCNYGIKVWWQPPSRKNQQLVFNVVGKICSPFGKDD